MPPCSLRKEIEKILRCIFCILAIISFHVLSFSLPSHSIQKKSGFFSLSLLYFLSVPLFLYCSLLTLLCIVFLDWFFSPFPLSYLFYVRGGFFIAWGYYIDIVWNESKKVTYFWTDLKYFFSNYVFIVFLWWTFFSVHNQFYLHSHKDNLV